MSEERAKILEMLAEGKISAADAERLLDRLTAPPSEPESGRASDAGDTETGERPTSLPRFLRVVVDSSDGDKVNVRVPIALVRTGLNLATMVPAEAGEKLADSGIDLSALSSLKGDELIEALRELSVDVDSSDGDTVRVFCE